MEKKKSHEKLSIKKISKGKKKVASSKKKHRDLDADHLAQILKQYLEEKQFGEKISKKKEKSGLKGSIVIDSRKATPNPAKRIKENEIVVPSKRMKLHKVLAEYLCQPRGHSSLETEEQEEDSEEEEDEEEAEEEEEEEEGGGDSDAESEDSEDSEPSSPSSSSSSEEKQEQEQEKAEKEKDYWIVKAEVKKEKEKRQQGNEQGHDYEQGHGEVKVKVELQDERQNYNPEEMGSLREDLLFNLLAEPEGGNKQQQPYSLGRFDSWICMFSVCHTFDSSASGEVVNIVDDEKIQKINGSLQSYFNDCNTHMESRDSHIIAAWGGRYVYYPADGVVLGVAVLRSSKRQNRFLINLNFNMEEVNPFKGLHQGDIYRVRMSKIFPLHEGKFSGPRLKSLRIFFSNWIDKEFYRSLSKIFSSGKCGMNLQEIKRQIRSMKTSIDMYKEQKK